MNVHPSLRLAIVGCGSVSERFHAPALGEVSGFAPVVMVDRDAARAEALARAFPGAQIETNHKRLAGQVDAAIVALPNHLNASVSADLLRMGIAVLVEKPAALSVGDALMLKEAQGNAALTVGFIRREAAGIRFAKRCVESGVLGEIKAFSVEDGYAFNWQAVNEFRFDRTRGGGILNDIGSHVIDSLVYWFGDVSVLSYSDDNLGGVETNVSAEFATRSGTRGTMELSWTRELRNSAKIAGERGSVEVRWYGSNAFVSLADSTLKLDGAITTSSTLADGAETFPSMFVAQLRRWRSTLATNEGPASKMAGADEALRNIELISQCKAIRQEMVLPWRSAR